MLFDFIYEYGMHVMGNVRVYENGNCNIAYVKQQTVITFFGCMCFYISDLYILHFQNEKLRFTNTNT